MAGHRNKAKKHGKKSNASLKAATRRPSFSLADRNLIHGNQKQSNTRVETMYRESVGGSGISDEPTCTSIPHLSVGIPG
jgi:hypothetical protein